MIAKISDIDQQRVGFFSWYKIKFLPINSSEIVLDAELQVQR